MDFELLAVLLNVGFNAVTTVLPVVDALNSLAASRQAQAASLPVTLAQSCSLKAVADAVRDRRPRDWMAQEPCRSFDTDTLRALRSAGRWRSGPAAPWFSAEEA